MYELFRNFEIEVNGRIVHSKKTKGHGFLHTNAAQQKVVFAAIGMFLYRSFLLFKYDLISTSLFGVTEQELK